MKYKTQTPRVASYLLIRQDEKVAFVFRKNTGWMNDHYGLPSGKVENDESYLAAACREAKEEVGILIKPRDLHCVHIMHRREESDWVDVYFEVSKYEGDVFNAEPDIHGELAWLNPNNLPDNVVPSVVYAIEQVEKGKFYSEYGWSQAD